MPEEIEVDTDKLHEEIHEELEREGGSMLKMIALTTALFAALAAVAALRAGGTVNEALVMKTEATRLQAEASDQWAAYQAKGIKSTIQQASESAWLALGKQPPASFSEERQRYAREQADLARVAHDKERERDGKVSRGRPSDASASSVRQQRRAVPGGDRAWRGGGAHPGAAGLVRLDSGWSMRRRAFPLDRVVTMTALLGHQT